MNKMWTLCNDVIKRIIFFSLIRGRPCLIGPDDKDISKKYLGRGKVYDQKPVVAVDFSVANPIFRNTRSVSACERIWRADRLKGE
uniref:Uncharacterized protein n=1 Tax=Heterorhabditis bacteriophora TaxID=37862 RepID=A0A1I7X2H9_HETBA